jgi:hypothetical protein
MSYRALPLLLCGVVFADDHDLDTRSREIDLNVSGEKFEVSAEQEFPGKDGKEDEVEFRGEWAAGNLLEFEISYSSEAGSLETEVELEIEIQELIEFEESGQNPGFQPTEDTIVSSYIEDDASSIWNDWNLDHSCATSVSYTSTSETATSTSETVTGTSASGDCYFQVSASTSDGVLGTVAYFTSQYAVVAGVPINSNTCKFDISINYPFVSSTSYLAVLIQAVSETEVDIDDDDNASPNEGAIVASNPDSVLVASFDWEKTATSTDGSGSLAVVDVIRTPHQNGTKANYYTFDVVNPTNVYWDPELGISSGQAAFPSLLVLLGVMAIL